jgi:glycine cleavage system transcriptional repressor
MAELAVTVIGHDRPGIVAAVTGALADVGGNLEDSSMTILRGHFAMTLVVSVDVAPDRVREVLAPVAERLGVTVAVNPVEEEPPQPPAGPHHVLSVHGADRPGIVAAVTGLLAERGGNITDLTTRLSGDLYLLVCEVDLPETVDPAAVSGDLAALGERLGVTASLRPADDELL